MYNIMVHHADGRRSPMQSQIADLGEACAYVLELADRLGSASDGGDRPRSVEIYCDGRLEISVAVVSGGLVSDRDAPEPRST